MKPELNYLTSELSHWCKMSSRVTFHHQQSLDVDVWPGAGS